jgi:peptidoglycan/LPS O-acetylase OafA/YrhL
MFGVLVFKSSTIPFAWNAIPEITSNGLSNMTHPFRSLFLHLSLTWSIVPDLGMKLNEPSWALTSFFLCYAITPFAAKFLFNLSSKKLWILFGVVFVPGIIWGLIYGFSGDLWFADFGTK